MDSQVTFAGGFQYRCTVDPGGETVTIHDVEVFADGTHNGEEYSAERVDAIIEADGEAREFINPKLIVGHPSDYKNPALIPSFGFLGKLRRAASKVVATFHAVPKDFFDGVIKTGRFSGQSIGLRPNFKHPNKEKIYPLVPDHVGFLGVAAAGVKTLKPLMAFSEDDPPACQVIIFREAIDTALATAEAEAKASEEARLDAERRSLEMGDKELAAREDALAKEKREFAEAQEAADKKLADEKAALKDEQTKMFAERVDDMWGRILDGRHAKPAEKDSFCTVAMGLTDTEKREFADHNGVNTKGTLLDQHYSSWMSRTVKGVPTKSKPAGKTTETEEETDPGMRMFSEARELAEKDGIPEDIALGIVERKHPELLDEFRSDTFKPGGQREEG